jgi:hypothetical protein
MKCKHDGCLQAQKYWVFVFGKRKKCTGVTLFEGINSFDWVLNS